MTDLKINKELIVALVKLREVSIVFDKQSAAIAKESDRDYTNEGNTFNHGIYECMDAISKMIGEAAVNGVYGMISNTIE